MSSHGNSNRGGWSSYSTSKNVGTTQYSKSSANPSSSSSQQQSTQVYKYPLSFSYPTIDIGANLTHFSFKGRYKEGNLHRNDMDDMLKRAFEAGVKKIIITGTNLHEAKEAFLLCKQYRTKNQASKQQPLYPELFFTVGVHPSESLIFEDRKRNGNVSPQEYLNQLKQLALQGKEEKLCVSFGEIGLDYDRLFRCPQPTQLKYFEEQLKLAAEIQLPLFLHERNANPDFSKLIVQYKDHFPKAVVHCFTSPIEVLNPLQDLIKEGKIYIGLTGISLRTKENVATAKLIPQNRILLETDCPFCAILPKDEGFQFLDKTNAIPLCDKFRYKDGFPVKQRNEPLFMVQVLEAMANARGESMEQLAKQVYQNTLAVFPALQIN